MDRFSWSDGVLTHDEQLVCHQTGVRLYDGHDKAGSCFLGCLVFVIYTMKIYFKHINATAMYSLFYLIVYSRNYDIFELFILADGF